MFYYELSSPYSDDYCKYFLSRYRAYVCIQFQIVNMAVSRSSPMMIATRMAKRGRCNYVAMYGDESENSDNGSRVEKDLVELNKQLNYTGKPLEAVRFNA